MTDQSQRPDEVLPPLPASYLQINPAPNASAIAAPSLMVTAYTADQMREYARTALAISQRADIEPCPELNMSNHNEDDVAALNDWAVRADALLHPSSPIGSGMHPIMQAAMAPFFAISQRGEGEPVAWQCLDRWAEGSEWITEDPSYPQAPAVRYDRRPLYATPQPVKTDTVKVDAQDDTALLRMLTREEVHEALPLHMTSASSAALAIQRKFCEVNGLLLDAGTGEAKK